MGAVILDGINNSLSIEVTGTSTEIACKGWTYFHLIGQKITYLGADVVFCLTSLWEWLRAEDISDWQPQWKIDDVPVNQFFMLWEKHHVLYAGVDSPDRMLFWNNAGAHHPDGEMVGTVVRYLDPDLSVPIPLSGIMCLSPAHRENWVEALTAILESP